MQFFGILLVFGGYTLVYAATARGGKFATEPWAGLFADAYTATSQDFAAGASKTLGGSFSPISPAPPNQLPG